MQNHLVRRGAIGLVAGALALAGTASLPTPAHASVDHGEVQADLDLRNNGPIECKVSPYDNPTYAELVDNGVAVSHSWSANATGTHTGNPADVTTLSASSQVTASMTPIGSGPSTIKASLSASASTNPALAESACSGEATATPRMSASFVLAQPMWATITGSGDGSGAGQAVIGDDGGSAAAVVVGTRGEGSATMLLPAGPTFVQVQAQANVHADDAVKSRSYSVSFTIELKPLGSASAVSGNSKGLVQFGNRDCATGNVTVDLTKKAKKKAKQALVSVNGTKVARLKGKKLKPRTLVVPAARGAAAEVRIEVKLKNGKKATVTRSYLACA